MASLKTEVACRPLRYREIPRTVDVTERVFRDTPFFNYVFFPSPDARDPRVCKLGARLVTTIQNANYVSQKEAITVDGGDGFVTFVSPRNGLSPWRKIFQRMMQTLAFVFIFLITKLTSTEEQRQRMKETRQRNNALRGSVIGGQLDDVFLIDILAVSPDKQSLGYGCMLLEAVTSQCTVICRCFYEYSPEGQRRMRNADAHTCTPDLRPGRSMRSLGLQSSQRTH
ncbi:predicted protein [Sparassis crispa]|uniref:N-acetyltransferase domain-containing protein n=1 Tax=Sparassis crispa TaxID=139825 RepID=A0A401H3K6_9APHY|nr:predicted protein [Sparassis crispa]GBE88992.1 predicted protein [Sparassis crispa]